MCVVAVDTETETFAQARMAPPLVCASVADEHGVALHHVNDSHDVIYNLFDAAASRRIWVAGHNFAYDVAVFMAQWPEMAEVIFRAYEQDRVSDTMIRQKILDIAEGCYRGYTRGGDSGGWIKHGYRLDDLSQRHLDRKLDKDSPWRLRYAELKPLPISEWPAEAVGYAKDDGGATRDVWWAQHRLAEQLPTVLADEFRQARAALALHLASVWGMRTDVAAVEALQKGAKDEISILSEMLIQNGLLGRNGSRKIKRAQDRMLAVNPNGKKTKTKKACIDEETCLDSGDEVLIGLARYGKAQNILAKDVKALARGIRFPIHTTFDSLMETGRTSSSGAYNLQNPRRKKGVRECFVPREGHYFAACDIDKAELHTLAQICLKTVGYSRLAERLNAGFDPHLDLGAQILGISYEEALEYKDEPEVKEARQHAKPANFGFPGGMGVQGFIAYAKKDFGIVFKAPFVKKLKEHWLGNWPEMVEYFAWVRQLLGSAEVGTITQFFSQRRRGLVTFTVASNGFFQGLSADAIKMALWEVCKKQYTDPESALWGCRTVNIPHDELIAEVPIQSAHEAAMEFQETIVSIYNRWVPDVPATAAVALMKRWSKAAEPVWVDGRLVPWQE